MDLVDITKGLRNIYFLAFHEFVQVNNHLSHHSTISYLFLKKTQLQNKVP